MKTRKFFPVFSALALSGLLLGACGGQDVIVTANPDGTCPPGSVPLKNWDAFEGIPNPAEYCQLEDSAPTPPPVLAESHNPLLAIATLTPTPPAQTSNSGIPDLKPAIEVVQYCANKGANLGGVNITFPLESTLHIDEWFSQSPGHVKCVDDLSNPRTCWGPESATFEVLLCNTDFVQNQDYTCETLPVTLGSCGQKPGDDNQADPVPTACGHC